MSNQIMEELDDIDLYEDPIRIGRYELPGVYTMAYLEDCVDDPPEELIGGILRKGRKMLLSGAAKSYKSWLMMELAIALATGGSWLGLPCCKSKVLYINLEIPVDTFKPRLYGIMEELGLSYKDLDSQLLTWHLVGSQCPLSAFVKTTAKICKEFDIDAVIIDPIYKIMNCDENNAKEVGKFFNKMDQIARYGDCSVILVHHHSKGAKGNRLVLDRSSGSGVFARDPDAILDMIELEPSKAALEQMGDEKLTAWRIEAVLREFASIDPINCWFRFPLHVPDTEGLLTESAALGSGRANLEKSSKRVPREERESLFHKAYASLSEDGMPVMIADMARVMKVSEQTVRNRCSEMQDQYWLKHKMIGKLAKPA